MIISLGFAWIRFVRATAQRAADMGLNSARFNTDTIRNGVRNGSPLAVDPSPVASRITIGRAGMGKAALMVGMYRPYQRIAAGVFASTTSMRGGSALARMVRS